MSTAANAVSLSLVSHTNAGKTTLARTLLGRDIGEVRDAPHVTEFADVHTLLETAQGERLLLWDTPGFGDSARLVKRLRQAEHPVGWFMSQVWDRWRDRPFWSSQQALRNVREEADVMLYLVNAAEEPDGATYVAAEMALLGWVGKPVLVLLNQLGAPREAAAEAAELARWRRHLASFAAVRGVIPLDAFARCWVQEAALMGSIEQVLDGAKRPLMERLSAAWRATRRQTFVASMGALAGSLARLAMATEVVPSGQSLGTRLRQLGAAIGLGKDAETAATLAQQALAQRLADEVQAQTRELIGLHGLAGDAAARIQTRIAEHYAVHLRLDETQAAVWGAMLTGAAVGLKADVLSGGLTLGGGLLTGGLLGALGAAGLVRGVNLVRGTDRSWVAWNAEALDPMVDAALLRYLAVAHFGRGRGDWAEGESPAHWKDVVAAALAPHRDALAALWSGRDLRNPAADATAALAAKLQAILGEAASAALARLYPDAAGAVAGPLPPLRETIDRPRDPLR